MDVLNRLAGLKIPTTAVVHGVCLGGGLELALTCRNRAALASVAALQIGSPEVQLGLIPAWAHMVQLARLIAPRDALNLLLTGKPIGFLQAKSQGLVDRLVSQEEQDRIAETLQIKPRQSRALDRATWDQELRIPRGQGGRSTGRFSPRQSKRS